MELYPHQERALEKMKGKRNFCVFADPGTGKTKICIERVKQIHNAKKAKGAIVFAPKGVHRQWAEEQILQHHPEADAWWWNGRNLVQSHASYSSSSDDDCVYYCFNYDVCRSKKGIKVVNEALKKLGNFVLIMDESHNIKNKRSKRWKFMNTVANYEECISRLAVTGTPIAKNLIDEWCQLLVVDPNILKIKYITHFKNSYCIMGGFEGKNVIGVRNLERYKKITEPYVFRVSKKELDLEAKQYSTYNFDMTSEQRMKYLTMAKALITILDTGDRVEASSVITKIQKLQQISNGFIINEEGEVMRLFDEVKDNPRIAALHEIISSTEDKSPIIIWCRYIEDAKQVTESLPEQEARRYDGTINEKTRKQTIEDWKQGKFRFLVATAAAAGVGLNLQGRCTQAIYFSNTENAIHRWQSEDRIHRIGTKGIVTYTDMICTASRDRAILRNLKAKKSLSDLRFDQVKHEIEDTLLFSRM